MTSCGYRCWHVMFWLVMTVAAMGVWVSPCEAQFGGRGFGAGGPSGGPPAAEEPKRKLIPYYEPQNGISIQEVKIIGNRAVPTQRIESMIRTRRGRVYDPEQVQNDVRTLIGSGLFSDVRPYHRESNGGVAVTFEVFERPVVKYVHFVGNEKIKDKVLRKNLGLAVGDPLNQFGVDEARRQLAAFYREKGYSLAQVSIIKGTNSEDDGVAFRIHEGPRQRIRSTKFVGNSIASDARLKTQIKSKPGWFYFFGGKISSEQVEQDIERLTMYYRSLGFFRARVGPQVTFDENQKWSNVRFVIDEGPRYRVNEIRLNGNQEIDSHRLMEKTELREGAYFSLARMQRDLNTLRDQYGSQGYVYADVQANPQFFEQPGIMDIVYNIKEGEQWRVGRVHVIIDGENSHTRRNVVLNRLSVKPGDIVDVREIRSSERRLQHSQLFMANPQQGVMPRIEVRPAAASMADERGNAGDGTFRGQSPTGQHAGGGHLVDLIIHVPNIWEADSTP